jgi:hypothetical protein
LQFLAEADGLELVARQNPQPERLVRVARPIISDEHKRDQPLPPGTKSDRGRRQAIVAVDAVADIRPSRRQREPVDVVQTPLRRPHSSRCVEAELGHLPQRGRDASVLVGSAV